MPLPFATPTDATIDALVQLAGDLGKPGADRAAAAQQIIEHAGGDRGAIEEARNIYARRLHGRSSDWNATGALAILNRALTDSGWTDPFSWKGRRKP